MRSLSNWLVAEWSGKKYRLRTMRRFIEYHATTISVPRLVARLLQDLLVWGKETVRLGTVSGVRWSPTRALCGLFSHTVKPHHGLRLVRISRFPLQLQPILSD